MVFTIKMKECNHMANIWFLPNKDTILCHACSTYDINKMAYKKSVYRKYEIIKEWE